MPRLVPHKIITTSAVSSTCSGSLYSSSANSDPRMDAFTGSGGTSSLNGWDALAKHITQTQSWQFEDVMGE